ncbi:MAG: hypothetical protein E7176_00925 [Erysipelotrichaceae bacterium]|nr:hypothetical protein [Erysipelotrichaceae bacterium]
MKNLSKIFSILFLLAGLFILASCSKGTGINGELSYVARRTELEVTADFEKNEKLEEENTSVSLKLYTSDETYKSTKSLKLSNGINGTETFTGLTQNTEYIIKLFVSYEGEEEEINSITAKTTNTGDSEESAKVISTADEFLAIKDDAEGYYKLANDIDFEEATVSLFTAYTSGFKGTFDGNGHTISNIKLSVAESTGVFGTLDGATIKNLKIDNVALAPSTTVKWAGAVAGYVKNSTIENVEVSNFTIDNKTASQSAHSYIGCFIGQALNADNKENLIKNCKVIDSSITFSDLKVSVLTNRKQHTTGLFAGAIADMTTIENCVANGSIDATIATTNSDTFNIGGFVGVNTSNKKILSCITNVNITIKRNLNSAKSNTIKVLNVGGFVGANTTGYCNVEDSLAIADIYVGASATEGDAPTIKLADKAYIGGFVGVFESRSTSGIKNCVYQPKEKGIKIESMPTGSYTLDDDENITATTYDILVGITFGKVDSSLASKIINVYSTENKLTYDIVKAYMSDGDSNADDHIEDADKLAEIKADIVDTSSVDANAKNNLSEAIKNYSFN